MYAPIMLPMNDMHPYQYNPDPFNVGNRTIFLGNTRLVEVPCLQELFRSISYIVSAQSQAYTFHLKLLAFQPNRRITKCPSMPSPYVLDRFTKRCNGHHSYTMMSFLLH